MRATYQDFLNEHPKCGKNLETNFHAQAVFMKLSTDNNIITMIDASNAGRPAVEAVALSVEAYNDCHKPSEFDVSIGQRRTVVGCMIKTILAPFGYLPIEPKSKQQKELSKSKGAKYFTSGTCYAFDETAPITMCVRRIVEEIGRRNAEHEALSTSI